MNTRRRQRTIYRRRTRVGRPIINGPVTPLTDEEFEEWFSHSIDEVYGKLLLMAIRNLNNMVLGTENPSWTFDYIHADNEQGYSQEVADNTTSEYENVNICQNSGVRK